MRFLVITIVFFFLAGTTTMTAQPANARDEPKLEVRTRVSKTEYCRSSELKLHIDLNYKNVGATTVLLNRFAATPVLYRVSKSLDNLRLGVFELNSRYTVEGTAKAGDLFRDEPGPGFVALAPGEEFSPTLEEWGGPGLSDRFVLLNLDCGDGDPCLRQGKHVLQLKIITLWVREQIANDLRERWRSKGELYSNDIISEPVEFEVEPRRARKMVKCN